MAEELVTSRHHIRGSVPLLIARILGILFLLDSLYAAVFLAATLSGLAAAYPVPTVAVLWVVHTVRFLAVAFLVVRLVVDWASTVYYVSEHLLVRFRGLVEQDENVYDLRTLKVVELHDTWASRLLHAGDVFLVVSSSGYREDVWLRGIANPKKYERLFRQHLDHQPPGAAGTGAPL